jgi:threonine dehydrogenase-like Zn-dependent dehydrogenase
VRYSGISVGTELLTLQQSSEGPEAAGERLLGYQCCGIIMDTPADVSKLRAGSMVACYGGPYVHHAEYLDVPPHLLAPLPGNVSPEAAAYAGLGTIALHAFRITSAGLGETVAVLGLGMLGNLIAQVAHAAGCRVVAAEPNMQRRHLAEASGMNVCENSIELLERVQEESDQNGADAVLVAAGNATAETLHLAFDLVRRGGTVSIVGLCDADVPREAMFQKEARLIVPRAGGPGRYDSRYEMEGIDYPIEHARWTEHRNLKEFLRLLSTRAVQMDGLYETAPVSEAPGLYSQLQTAALNKLGVVLEW